MTENSFRSRHVVVTGGAGFIGANVTRALLADGFARITILDDLSTGNAQNFEGLDVEFVPGSIEDADLVQRVVGVADAVVHLGAQGSVALSVDNPMKSYAVNVTGSMNVLEAARPNAHRTTPAHVLLASSAAVYGTGPELPKRENMAPEPASPYAATKIAMENLGFAYQRTYGVPLLAFRFFNVFGPFQPADHAYAPVIPAFIDRALGGRPLTVHGDGAQTRDFVFVETVATMIADALRRKVTAPHPVNVGSGVTMTLTEVIDILAATIGTEIERIHVDPRQGDIRHSSADVSHMRALFGDLEGTPFAAALERTVDWWRTAGIT